MIVPANRLLAWAAVLVPSTLLTALAPRAAWLPVLLFSILLAVASADALMAILRRKKIRIVLPEVVRMSRNRPALIPISLHKDTGNAVNIRIGLPLPEAIRSDSEYMDLLLPAGSRDSFASWLCTPAQRGVFSIPAGHIETTSPMGFWNVRRSSSLKSELRVYPDIARERRRLAAVFLNRGSFGIHTHRTVGQGRDFERLRDYMPGDCYDDIHWKATAKRSHPVTKLFQIEKTQEIYVVIDSSRLSARTLDKEPVIERFIASALLLGLATERQSDLFGLVVFGSRPRRFIRASGGKAHFNSCRDALYTLAPETANPDFDELRSFIRVHLRRRALLMILTDLSDPIIAESFLRNIDIVSRQHLVLVSMLKSEQVSPLFSAPDVTHADMLYRKLGGDIAWHSLKETERALRRHGVGMSLVEADGLSTDLVTRYMDVKSRQAL